MSRIIKFRAFMPKEHKMINTVFGSVGFRDGDAGRTFYRPTAMVDDDSNLFGHDWILMQYTGLKDKNGVEIYEGDVLAVDHQKYLSVGDKRFYRNGSKNRVVKWRVSSHQNGWNIYSAPQTQFEVIGNVYSNPELLEQPNEPR